MSQTKAQLIDAVNGSIVTADLADDAVNADKLASNSVVSASIVDGSIVNADINASAAIAGSKISPAFSANITTTGNAVIGGTTINTAQDKALSIFGTNGSELKLQATNFGGTAADGGASLTCTFGSFFITNNNANGKIHFQTKVSGQSTSEKMVLTQDGKLGIGTTSPGEAFHVTGGHGAGVLAQSAGTTSGGLIRMQNTQSSTQEFYFGVGGGANNFVTGRGLLLRDVTQNATRLVVLTDGKVGIGTIAPDEALHVAGNVINTTSVSGTGDSGFQIASGHRLGFDQPGTRSWSIKATDGCLVIDSGDGNSGPRVRGLLFGSDTADANKLDDYEEGTFSATASAAGYSGGNAISMSGESYTKIGRVVYFRMHLTVASNLSDGDLTITGLPFTAGADSVVSFAWQDAAGFAGGQGIITGTQCVRFNGVFPTHSSGNAVIRFAGTYNV